MIFRDFQDAREFLDLSSRLALGDPGTGPGKISLVAEGAFQPIVPFQRTRRRCLVGSHQPKLPCAWQAEGNFNRLVLDWHPRGI